MAEGNRKHYNISIRYSYPGNPLQLEDWHDKVYACGEFEARMRGRAFFRFIEPDADIRLIQAWEDYHGNQAHETYSES